MKYLSPEMEIVEFDESILTLGLDSAKEDNMTNPETGGGTFPTIPDGGVPY